MSKGSIVDTRVKMGASNQLLKILYEHRENFTELPENIIKALKANDYDMNVKVEISTEELSTKLPVIDTKFLSELRKDYRDDSLLPDPIPIPEEGKEDCKISHPLNLTDLIWLNKAFEILREKTGLDLYLHELLTDCKLQLPENSIIERNPELEKRCQRLRDEQENLAYLKMTKSVDASIKHCPEDTIAYQMKSLNRQIIAIFQFVVSVITGFVFGFIGVPLLVGNMDFGSRIMLGIFCAIIIAIAEFYFLAKKLSEYDNPANTLKKQMKPMSRKIESKPHKE